MAGLQSTLLLGRALQQLQVDDRVLIVTSPTLVYTMLYTWLADEHRKREALNENLIGMMDAVQANPQHGVLPGVVTRIETEALRIGLWPVEAIVDTEATPLFDTEKTITAAIARTVPDSYRELDENPFAIHSTDSDYDEADFARDHPWFTRLGLSGRQRRRILSSISKNRLSNELAGRSETELDELAEYSPALQRLKAIDGGHSEQITPLRIAALRRRLCRKPGEYYYLVFPDSDKSHQLLHSCLNAFCAR